MRIRSQLLLASLFFAASGCGSPPPASAASVAAVGPIDLAVDAREAPRSVLHAHLSIPVRPGALTLAYPKWIPGEHGPTGPLVNMTSLRVSAAGKPLAWSRDGEQIYEVHVTVPAGVTSIAVDLDYLEPTGKGGGDFGAGVGATTNLLALNWNQVLVYPKGPAASAIPVRAKLTLPDGWKWATALPVDSAQGASLSFKPASLETLVDSPVLAGAHMKTVALSEGAQPHFLDLASDSEDALAIPPQQVAAMKQLVAEAGALFGARHYRDYHFLYTLSDQVSSFGLEHHESSDDRMPERTLLEDDRRRNAAGLLPHEFVHSWNGKYRRPTGLATKDYQEPMKGELLWVYEGLTEYLGWVLTGRSGLLSEQEEREWVASNAASLDRRPGRQWRPLADTAVAAQVLYASPSAWRSSRRGVDFYSEGLLLWLEVDVTLRDKSQGKRSLDDFCQRFHGGASGAPEVKPYDLAEIVRTLNELVPMDWAGFFAARVNEATAHPPMGGITQGGYTLAFDDKDNVVDAQNEKVWKFSAMPYYALGFWLEEDRVGDVLAGSPAARAGLVPSMRVVAVDGRRFSTDLLHLALERTKAGGTIELIVEAGDAFSTLKVESKGGEQHPHLVRDAQKADLLAAILSPKTPRPAEAVMPAPAVDAATEQPKK